MTTLYNADLGIPLYLDSKGRALEGLIYFGVPNLNPVTNPATVYWDAAGTQPAAQPIAVSGGRTVRTDGTPARVWISGDYSKVVLDPKGGQVDFQANQQTPAIPVTIIVDKFSGTGAPATYPLSVTPRSINDTSVFVGGVYQQKSSYTLVGNQLTITAASGTNNVEVNTAQNLDWSSIASTLTTSAATAQTNATTATTEADIATTQAANAAASAAAAGSFVSPVSVADYTGLRAYAGTSVTLNVTGYLGTSAPSGTAGTFTRDDTDTTSADNGGTIIVASNGKRWKRLYVGFASVRWWGVVGDGTTSDSATLQAAISTGLNLSFPGATYRAANLTQTTSFQRFRADGDVRIMKNANGPILTSSGSDVEFAGIGFRGESATPAFTGDNLVSTGDNLRLINCGSRWAYGRGVKASGNHVQIVGTCDLYQTTDATATGFDIEVGVSGTATLYHHIQSIKSGQRTGGIKFVDCGSQTFIGNQIGKVYIAAGTKPTGCNGGHTIGNRILGDVTVEQSSALLSNNLFDSGIAITFAAGTSACRLDLSNALGSGATITNNGNINNLIEREVSSGSTIQKKWGDDSSSAVLTMNATDATQQFLFSGTVVAPNTRGFKIKDSGGTVRTGIVLSSGDDFTVGDNTGAGNFMNLVAGDGGIFANVGGTTVVNFYTGGFRPQVDNTMNNGTASLRWAVVYAATGTINTSDARSKQQVRTIGDAERAAAVECKGLLRAFKFNDAVEKKGDGARWHFGVIAQEVGDAFRAQGLDPSAYGLFCHDEWPAQEEVCDDEGNVLQAAQPAGDRFGVRYEELLAFMLAAL